MYELFDIKDKVIAFTGGTGVLGESMVKYLASHGAKVAVLARSKEKGDKLVEEVKEKGNEAMFLVTDVTNETILKQNAEDIIEQCCRWKYARCYYWTE
jgi:NADP-dependent 3-hydroxy acid dehydrogenase YdfG